MQYFPDKTVLITASWHIPYWYKISSSVLPDIYDQIALKNLTPGWMFPTFIVIFDQFSTFFHCKWNSLIVTPTYKVMWVYLLFPCLVTCSEPINISTIVSKLWLRFWYLVKYLITVCFKWIALNSYPTNKSRINLKDSLVLHECFQRERTNM